MSRICCDPRIIHARIMKHLANDKATYNSLINQYSKSKLSNNVRQSYALKVFHTHLSKPTVVSWTCLISALGDTCSSLTQFVSMLRYGTVPNQRSLAVVFKACANLGAVCFGLQIHGVALKMLIVDQPFAGSALVSFYSKSGRLDDAQKVFDELSERDAVCYSALIVGLAQNSRPFESLSCFSDMLRCGARSTEHSVSALLSAAADISAIELCKVLHCHSVLTGHFPKVVVSTSLLDAYGKCGFINDARMIFEELLDDMNLIGWNAMMFTYAQRGEINSVLEIFTSMEAHGFAPDNYTFLAILTSLQNSGLPDEAEKWLTKMISDYNTNPRIEHYTCVITALGGVGRLKEALSVAMSMPYEPDEALWRTLLTASALHGDVDMVWFVSKKLIVMNPCDESAYVARANVLSSRGEYDEVADLRNEMENGLIRKVTGKSWL